MILDYPGLSWWVQYHHPGPSKWNRGSGERERLRESRRESKSQDNAI